MKLRLVIYIFGLTIVVRATARVYACCEEPVAYFTGPSAVYCGDNATFTCLSYDVDSAISSRSWSASEGTPSTGSGTTFTTKWCTTGTKYVTLTVWDSDCSAGCCPDKSDSYGRTTYVLSVEVVSVSSYNSLCVNCNFDFTATTNPEGKYTCLEWTGGGTPATGSGQTFTTRWSTTGTKTVTASCCGGSKSKQVTVAAPTNFREVSWEDLGDGTLRFEHAWDSTSGNLFDLIGCMVGEKVDYPGGDPYFWPEPWVFDHENPFTNNHEAMDGGIIDTHGPDNPTAPYCAAGFIATQVYRWRDCQENYTTLLGPISIYRIISGEGEVWRYSIIKSGGYAEIFPLP